MHFPPGTIGVLSGDQSRWTWFQQSLLALSHAAPAGTEVLWVAGLWIATAVNRLAQQMSGDWLLLLADDHIVPPDMIQRLLAHDLPLVAPLCCLRSPPYLPSLFRETAHGYQPYTWAELAGQQGLLAVDTFGGPGVLIRREVLASVGQPFFEARPGNRETPQEDLYAFSKCRAAGFQPTVDLDLPIGHILPAAVFPQAWGPQQWAVRLWAEKTLATLYPLAPEKGTIDDYHART